MTEEQKKYHNTITEKAKQLSDEADRLMEITDSFAEKEDKEQFREYWIQSAKKNLEAQKLLTADIEKLMEEIMEFVGGKDLNN